MAPLTTIFWLGFRCRLSWRSAGSFSSSPTTSRSGAAFRALPSNICGNTPEDSVPATLGKATPTTRLAPLRCTRISSRWLCVPEEKDLKWRKLKVRGRGVATHRGWTFWPGRACRAAMERSPSGRPWRRSWRRVSSDHLVLRGVLHIWRDVGKGLHWETEKDTPKCWLVGHRHVKNTKLVPKFYILRGLWCLYVSKVPKLHFHKPMFTLSCLCYAAQKQSTHTYRTLF